MHYLSRHNKQRRRESGAVLSLAMMCLAVLTLLGMSGMQASRLEMLLAGNRRLQTDALAQAEYVLAAAEAAVIRLTTNPFDPDIENDHFYPLGTIDFNPATPGEIDHPGRHEWNFVYASLPPDSANHEDLRYSGSGDYVIEDHGLLTLPGEDASVSRMLRPLPGARMQAFRITARSTRARGAQRRVQSVLLREPLPRRHAP